MSTPTNASNPASKPASKPAAASAPVLLITGASRGIGAATARLAARRGWDLAINYARDSAAAEAVAADVRRAGQRAITVAADVADEAAVLAMFARVDAELGPLAGLVNNAGIVAMKVAARPDGRGALAAHVGGQPDRQPVVRARGGAPHEHAPRRCGWRHRQPGQRGGAPGRRPALYVDYAASKGAIDTFTVGLAQELAAEGIRVNAVRPGIIDTDIHADSGDRGRPQSAAAVIPLGRAGTADEIAAAVLWLLSAEASYTTGAILDVGGGR